MWLLAKRNPVGVLLAVVLHLVLLSLLFLPKVFHHEVILKPKKKPLVIVQARLVDQAKINAEKARIQTEKDRVLKVKEEARLKEKRKKAKAEKLRQKKKADKLALEKKKKEAARKKKLEKKRKKEEAARKEKRLKQKKKQKAKAKKAKADKLRKEKADRLRKEKDVALAKVKKEKQRKEALIQRQKVADDLRQGEMLREQRAEQQRLAREQAMQAELDQMQIEQYTPLIQEKVTGNWIFAGKSEGLSCTLRVRLAPGGLVLDVKLIASSGNRAFDRSAIAAVRKAEILPVPSGGSFNRSFKTITFKFKPD